MSEEVAQPVTPQVTTPSAPLTPVETVSAPETKVDSHETVVTPEPTILGVDDAPVVEEKAPEVKPVEAKTEEVKPENKTDGAEKQPEVNIEDKSSQSDEPAPLPSFEPWTFPEGVVVDEARIGEFNKELGEFARDTKVDAKLVQGLGQKLIERHVSEVQAVAQKVAEAYDKVWKDQTKSWYDAFVNDPEIGGNRQETTTASAREFIRKHGGTPEQQAEIRTLMQQTGIGNHPAVIRLFAKANSNLAEGKPIPAGKPPAAPTSMKNRFYGKK